MEQSESRPLIGVPGQTLQAIDGIPHELPRSWVMNHRYFTALASVGAAPVMVPLIEDDAALRAIYDGLDGIFLAGGVDVDPASYDEPREPLCGRTDPPRDAVEVRFAQWARADGKPLLGVCRGLQIMSVAAGGSLYQDTTDAYDGAQKHDYLPTAGYARDFLAHTVRLHARTRLHRLFEADDVHVNSMHHQGLKRIPPGLVCSASAPDGLVEALEAPDHPFYLGVQWHPEMLVDRDAGTFRLFRAFVEAAAAYRAQRLAGRGA